MQLTIEKEKASFMKHWPVPNSYSKQIPEKGEPGSFWEDRDDDRRHCGVDIYAPEGSKIIAIETGVVIDTGVFTTLEMNPYWNKTYYIVIKTKEKVLYKYAELPEIKTEIGTMVQAGDVIGTVGTVINPENIGPETPFYIRELIHKGNPSMLHLELYKAPVMEVRPYKGGNFYGKEKPASLIDPTYFLNGRIKQERSPFPIRN